jgi:hypothetical protein
MMSGHEITGAAQCRAALARCPKSIDTATTPPEPVLQQAAVRAAFFVPERIGASPAQDRYGLGG